MAVLPDASNCVQTTLVGTVQGSLWVNKIHFQGEAPLGGATGTGLEAFNTAISTAWGTHVAPICNPLTLLTDVNSVDLTSRTAPTFYSHLVTPIAGTNTGTPLPTSAAICFSWHINRRYRGGHGRIYIPAGNQDDITNGRTLAAAFQTQANSAASGFFGALDGLSLGGVLVRLIVLSYFESQPDPDNPGENHSVLRSSPVPYPVTSARVRTRLDTQRRRLGTETV